jgi:AraC-like DNA-binding protein
MKAALQKSTIPSQQLFVVRHLKENHFDPVWHAHAEYQLFWVVKGTGTRFIGDSIKAFHPGELIFTGPHLPHLWRSDDRYFRKNTNLCSEGVVIYFNENFLGDTVVEKEEMLALKKLFIRSRRGLEFFGAKKTQAIQWMQELADLQGIQRVIRLLQILDLLAGTKEYHFISSTAYEEIIGQNEADRMNLVYEYVLKNFRQRILLEEVSALLHMTPTSFSRYFTMKNNRPFSKFVSEIRIKHACKLLTETNTSVEQICYDCGFNTLSNFNKQFREVMQQKPMQYKKEFMSL